jgi:enoyl-CoA hydratase
MTKDNDMTEAPHLLVIQEDSILIATLNRPDKLNAMSIELMTLLEDAVLRFRDTADLKVMLIRSTGRYFSAGADLKGDSKGGSLPTTGSGLREMHRRLPSRMRQIWDEMEAIEKPFVVAHQARCVGGSLEMSLSCDFRLAAKSASYAFPEAKFGILPATNGVSRLVRLVGPHWARLLVMANMPVDADEARNMGLVHKVFPDDSFEEDVMGFCRHLVQQNGEMMGAAKVAIELSADLPAHQAASVERLVNSSLMLGDDYQKLMTAHVASIGSKKG